MSKTWLLVLLAPALMASEPLMVLNPRRPPALVGTWAPLGYPCQGADAIIYEDFGGFRTRHSSGQWTQRASTLTMFTTYRESRGPRSRAFVPQQPETRGIIVSGDRMIQRMPDGTRREFRRCA